MTATPSIVPTRWDSSASLPSFVDDVSDLTTTASTATSSNNTNTITHGLGSGTATYPEGSLTEETTSAHPVKESASGENENSPNISTTASTFGHGDVATITTKFSTETTKTGAVEGEVTASLAAPESVSSIAAARLNIEKGQWGWKMFGILFGLVGTVFVV